MAQDPLASVYGGQIGQGQAQVFDTSGLAKQVVLQQKEKDKAFLDSIIDLDTSKVWSQDLPGYNEMWNKYRNYVSDNYKALSNPSRNVDKWSEKKRMEQEMLNYVATSNSQHKEHLEFTKSTRDTDKWVQTLDENELLPNGENNPNYGRALSDIWATTPLADRGNLWDTRTKKPKGMLHWTGITTKSANASGLAPVTIPQYNQFGDVIGSSTKQEYSDMYLKVGDILDPDGVPDSGDEQEVYNEREVLNPNAGQLYYDRWMADFDTSEQVRATVEYEYNQSGGDGNLESNYDDIREFWHSQASLNVKGMGVKEVRYKKTKPISVNIKNIIQKKVDNWDIAGTSDTYTSQNSSYVKANNGVGVTVFPMRYSGSTAPFMSTGSEFKGKIISNFGGDFSGATMPSNAKFDGFYKDDNGEIGFSVSMPSTVIEGQLSDKKKDKNSLQSQLDKVKKDNPQTIVNAQLVDNPKISELESKIYKLNKEIDVLNTSKGQAQRLMVPVEDENGDPINLSILDVNSLPSTIEDIEKVVGGRGKKKPNANELGIN
tara:strand:+ start:1944 stop:3575 length:1632 start_codon:yes stop_codon:yes gene_type:complete